MLADASARLADASARRAGLFDCVMVRPCNVQCVGYQTVRGSVAGVQSPVGSVRH